MTKATPEAGDTVRPVLFSSSERQLLLTPVGDVWAVPSIPIRPGETSRRAAVRHLRRELRLPTVRIMPVIGRLEARRKPTGAQYVVLVAPAAGSWPTSVGRALGPATRWWTTESLRTANMIVEPVQLLDLMDGYREGWLPDGEIALD
ncbi:hypothetical protein [Streptomyces sp. S4.7]|uniref:hypothetical protein n=1 Tax=Streptomyces sp. S4.7 TaxID=2705439 RepID=UPI0013DB4B06|nr:hypothetical protein [Streptomyces sp. S4.7]